MPYYQEIPEIIENVIGERILRNQNICKMLYYYPDSGDIDVTHSPKLDYSVYDNANIDDTSFLYMKNIFPLPKIPDSATEKQCFINVTTTGGYESERNLGYRRIQLVIDIICHLNVWVTKEGLRPYIVMSEIDKMLNDKLTDLPIENKPLSKGFQPRDYSYYFYGVQVLYVFNINSNISCSGSSKNIDIKGEEPDVPLYSFKPKNLNINKGE